jgi:hypothetical protein
MRHSGENRERTSPLGAQLNCVPAKKNRTNKTYTRPYWSDGLVFVGAAPLVL